MAVQLFFMRSIHVQVLVNSYSSYKRRLQFLANISVCGQKKEGKHLFTVCSETVFSKLINLYSPAFYGTEVNANIVFFCYASSKACWVNMNIS